MTLTKQEWILIVLNQFPLDRLRLMKTLFLIWDILGRKRYPDFFEFVPYLYGPCSFEVYSALEELSNETYIIQSPHPIQQWASYSLSERGKKKAEDALKKIDASTLELLKAIIKEVSHLSFFDLLKKVYREAPDYAVNSIFGGIVKP